MYQNKSNTTQQICSINLHIIELKKNSIIILHKISYLYLIEFEESNFDTNQKEFNSYKQSVCYSKDMNRNQFIANRIQCLQDQMKDQQLQTNHLKDINLNQLNQMQFESKWKEKSVRLVEQNDNKENLNNNNNIDRFYQDSKQSQMKSYEQMTELFHLEQFEEKDEVDQIDSNLQQKNVENQELSYEREASHYNYMFYESNNQDQDDEEQYDIINQQEYERMMSEVEDNETKTGPTSNTFENYQFFKPSFHEEILKKNNQGKRFVSFSKNDNFYEINDQQQLNSQQDNFILYPQDFSTFNENNSVELNDAQDICAFGNNEYKSISEGNKQIVQSLLEKKNLNVIQNLIQSIPNQESFSQKQTSIQSTNYANIVNNISNQKFKSDNQLQESFINKNKFKADLNQNSFQQHSLYFDTQQQNLSHLNAQHYSIYKNLNIIPRQQNLFNENYSEKSSNTSNNNQSQQYIVENERINHSNFIGQFDQSNKKENSRYNDQNNDVASQQNFVNETVNQKENQQNESQFSSSGNRTTNLTQLFSDNSNIISKDNTISNQNEEQLNMQTTKNQKNNIIQRQPAQSLHKPVSVYQQYLLQHTDKNQSQQLQNYLTTPPKIYNIGMLNDTHLNEICSNPQIIQEQNLSEQLLRSFIEKDQIQMQNSNNENKSKDYNNHNLTQNQNKFIQNQSSKILMACGNKKTNQIFQNDIQDDNNNYFDKQKSETHRDYVNYHDRNIINKQKYPLNTINSNLKNNTTQQQDLSCHITNYFQQSSPYLDYSQTDRPRHQTTHQDQSQYQENKQYNKQPYFGGNSNNEPLNKQLLKYNLNNKMNQQQQAIKNQDNILLSKEKNTKKPQFIQKQYLNVEKKLQMIYQQKSTSFHQSGLSKNTNEISQTSTKFEVKQSPQSNNQYFQPKSYQLVEDRQLQKSKEREILEKGLKKQNYIQSDEIMKMKNIPIQPNTLSQKIDNSVSVYERNQKFQKIKEQNYQQLKEEQTNPTKNTSFINKNTFKIIPNQKKESNIYEIQRLTYSQRSISPKTAVSNRNDSQNSKQTNNKQNSFINSTLAQNYTPTNTNSNQAYQSKELPLPQSQSNRSQNSSQPYSNNFSCQQTLSTQQSQSQSQSFLLNNQPQRQQNRQYADDQDIQSDNSQDKVRPLSNQKYSAADLGNVHTVKKMAESKMKIKQILQQKQNQLYNKDIKKNQNNQERNNKFIEKSNKDQLKKKEIEKNNKNTKQETQFNVNGVHKTQDNINEVNSQRQYFNQDRSCGTPRQYSNNSLKRTFDMRQNQIQFQSRDNSKHSQNNTRVNSNNQKRTNK